MLLRLRQHGPHQQPELLRPIARRRRAVTFDEHANGCGICVDITQDVMRLSAEGQSLWEIEPTSMRSTAPSGLSTHATAATIVESWRRCDFADSLIPTGSGHY